MNLLWKPSFTLRYTNKCTECYVWQSKIPTCFAMWSSVKRDASTRVRIDSVSTTCSIHTWMTAAFVDAYKNNITLWSIWKQSHKCMFCFPYQSSSHGLSLLVESRQLVLTEIHVVLRQISEYFSHFTPGWGNMTERTWLLEILASLDAFKILGYLLRLACFTVSLLTSYCAHHVTSVMWLWVGVPLLWVSSGCAGMPLTFYVRHALHFWCVTYTAPF